MKKNSLVEYLTYWLIRLLGFLVTALPLKSNFVLGNAIGLLGYFSLKKKRRLVIKNLKRAFPEYSYEEIEQIARKSFVGLALNIIEALYIPKINAKYINKHIRIENIKYMDDALHRGKGVILLAYHFGNWELANVTCGLLGYSYKVVVNEQRYTRINELLNRYRESKGCKTIPRGIALREILKALKNNEVVAMVGDQGGKDGNMIDFFNVSTSTPTGAVRFALSTGATVIPVFIMRERRFYHRIILEEPLRIEDTDNPQNDINNPLIQSNNILSSYIRKYPQEYFWFYKIWKYSHAKSFVVLDDGKAGHLRQSQAVFKISKGLQPLVSSTIIDVHFKNFFANKLFRLGYFAGIDLSIFCLKRNSYRALKKAYADLVISCGGSLSALNLLLAKENLAKSICIMKPTLVNAGKFDLVIVPKHDIRSSVKSNTIVTDGALNLIDERYLKEALGELKKRIGALDDKISLGLLVGGDSKRYKLSEEIIDEVLKALKVLSNDFNFNILATTSRRTSKNLEILIKKELKSYIGCKLLVIANENNIPHAVGGILGLSDFVIVSGESISMVSEAVMSGKYVLVFRPKSSGLAKKTRHDMFLDNLSSQGYIYIVRPDEIVDTVKDIMINKPEIKKLNDSQLVENAIKKLL